MKIEIENLFKVTGMMGLEGSMISFFPVQHLELFVAAADGI